MLAQAGGAGANSARPDVAAIDRPRILAEAERALAERPAPLAAMRSERSPAGPQVYFSEAQAEESDGGAGGRDGAFTAHRDALFGLGRSVGALAAAHLLTGETRYAEAAAAHLRMWFVDPGTAMEPRMDYAGVAPRTGAAAAVKAPGRPETARAESAAGPGNAGRAETAPTGSFVGVLETLPLVEVVQAIPFLAAAGALSAGDVSALRGWFARYLRWLVSDEDSGPRLAALARDHKDHHATSWALQAAAYTLFTAADTAAPKNEDRAMTELRRRFRGVIRRSQVAPEGFFRNEITSAHPYRDSLWNLDMMACLCMLLTTRFDSVWEYQLEDGPSMRSAVAYHFPFIANRAKWPYRADARRFSELPGRRVSLLFAARAYHRPEYAALWTTLSPDGVSPEVQRTMPVQQPLLWVRQAPRMVV